MTLRRRPGSTPTPEGEEMPLLPPLDGEEGEAPADEFDALLELPPSEGAAEELGEDEVAAHELLEEPQDDSWLEDAEAGDALDVGTFSEELGEDAGESWLGEESLAEAGEELGEDELPPSSAPDAGEEGPEHEPDELLDESGPSVGSDLDDEPLDDSWDLADTESEAPTLPAFALPEPSSVSFVRLGAEGVVFAAAAAGGRVVLGGDGVHGVDLAMHAPLDGRLLNARRIATPADELLTALAFVGERALIAATAHGRILRSEDEGSVWEQVAALGGEDSGQAAIELVVDRAAPGARVWARAHGGGLFRSDDRGTHWAGPVLPHPVRAVATDGQGGVVAAASSGVPQVLCASDGLDWKPSPLALPAPPVLVAARGDVWALAFARGAALVSVDRGRTAVRWPLLAGASAITLVETDDGAVHLLGAVYDDRGDHATLIAAAVDRDGAARGAHRIADLDAIFPATGDEPGEETEARVEALVPLDSAARRILVVTARGLAVITRDAG
jgi:hypothetical protein